MTWPTTQVSLCSWHAHKAISDKCRKRNEHVAPQNHRVQDSFWCSPMFNEHVSTQLALVEWQVSTGHERLDLSWVFKENLYHFDNFLADCQFNHLSDAQIENLEAKQYICRDQCFSSIALDMFMHHLHWHPQKHLHPKHHEDPTKMDVYMIWLSQVTERSMLCEQHRESFMWEYLWHNWYTPTRWILWARANSPMMPIIQSNGPVESHWAILKKWHLHASSHPTLALTCSIIMESFLQDRYNRITLYRLGRIRSSADHGFVQSWRVAKSTNRMELIEGVVNVVAT